MADTPPANLGYGQRDEAPIDVFNQWLRGRPEYQKLITSFGQNPNNVHLNDDQKQQVVRLAQSLGAVVDEGGNGQEVDESGNFRAKGHKLRNTLIVAGIAAAALATAGAAGAFGGAAAGGGSAATGATGAGTLASTAVPATGALATGTVASGAVPAALAGDGLLASTTIPALGSLATGSGSSLAAGTATAGGYMVDAAGNVIDAANVPPESGLGTWADRMAALARGANAVGTAVTGQDPALAGVGAANAAQQAARNRFLAAGTDQGGPAADKTSLSNMRLAGLISNFHDTPATQFGNPAINIGDSARDYASRFQKEILARQAAGKSATTFGVPDPTPQELADEEAARRASQGRSNVPGVGGRIIDGINTGARLAGAARTIWDLF